MLTLTYADANNIGVGDKVSLVGERKFEVVGLVEPPLGGEASDVYMQLDPAEISDRKGRVNAL